MSDDILETLQCGVPRYNEETRNYETLITKRERLAIAEIKRLRKENAGLREALKPFARAAEYCEGLGDLDHKSVLVGNFRAAAAAIRDGK